MYFQVPPVKANQKKKTKVVNLIYRSLNHYASMIIKHEAIVLSKLWKLELFAPFWNCYGLT